MLTFHSKPSPKEPMFRPSPKEPIFFLFKINALDKFGDSCWFTLVYNNVSPNGLYQNLVLPAKVTDRFGMVAPLAGPSVIFIYNWF